MVSKIPYGLDKVVKSILDVVEEEDQYKKSLDGDTAYWEWNWGTKLTRYGIKSKGSPALSCQVDFNPNLGAQQDLYTFFIKYIVKNVVECRETSWNLLMFEPATTDTLYTGDTFVTYENFMLYRL